MPDAEGEAGLTLRLFISVHSTTERERQKNGTAWLGLMTKCEKQRARLERMAYVIQPVLKN